MSAGAESPAARVYERLRVTREGAVVTLTLSNPRKRNAIGPTMANELYQALDDAESDDAVRVVVLTGDGDAFCAGGDFEEMATAAAAASGGTRPHDHDYADLLARLVRTEKPVVARVNGVAMGGGLGLVAASTFAIAADDATLGTPEIHVGLFPMMIMPVLARHVPRRRLLRMMLLGERFGAEEARALGLVGDVVPRASLDRAVQSLAGELAGKAPLAVKRGLRAFAAEDGRPLEESLPELRAALSALLATEDAREGLAAFLEKRATVFAGR